MKPISGMLTLLLAVSLLSGCSDDKTADIEQDSVEVELRTAEASANLSGMLFPAKVESNNQAHLSTIVMGTVTSAPVTVGDRVQKGDLLVRIKDDQIRAQKSQIEANMVQAKANLENTEKNYNRIKNLYAEDSATSKELDDISTMYEIAKANMEALEARLNEVNEMLSYTVIRAPFSGIVSSKFVSEGDMAAPGHPLVSVADPGSVKITATVAESQITTLEEGSIVTVSVSAAGVSNIPARLTAVSQAGDPISRQFSIEAVIDDSEISNNLKVGMFAQIGVKTGQAESLTIPADAIVRRGQLTGIYTISENNRAVLRWVRLGENLGDSVEILTGLKPGEQYVYAPGQSLRQGQLLSVR
ncbi:efflux RND transporter periplasmic adaptor subunit [Rhodohalobacter sp.]|uniref:efflux RND transporter periplasmic adaptor subunit n=1 Tax=Rhodohalobacter sp. TaxID=1974210 RepID=UPI002ACD53D6|nr:efflux RND transporter periplasmic adaptor subunit [Rhodohalobacter sp.]